MQDKKELRAQKMEAELEQIQADIDKFEAKAKAARTNSALSMREEVESLKEKKAAAENAMKRIKDAGSEASDDLKAGAHNAWRSLTSSLDRARSRFN